MYGSFCAEGSLSALFLSMIEVSSCRR